MNFEYKMLLMGVLLFAVGVPLVLKLVLPNSVVRSAGINLVMAGLAIVVTALVVPRLIPDYSEGARMLIIGTIEILVIVIMLTRILWQVFRL
jgi:hypothetical protein